MKSLNLILFFFIVVLFSARSQRLTNQIAVTPNQAITHSHNLLIEEGIELDWSPESSNFAVVRISSGKEGIFVALGYPGIGRGYQMLYQDSDSQLEMIALYKSSIVWGIDSLRTSG